MNNKARIYKSPITAALLENITPEELEKTESKMRLAVKIADAIKAKNYSKSEFAKKLNKNNSEISKWISGTHNFTHDTMILLENELDISLINTKPIPMVKPTNIQIFVQAKIFIKNQIDFIQIPAQKKFDYSTSYCLITA